MTHGERASFAAQLQRLMDAREMNQSELARLSGVTRQTVSRIVQGHTTPGAATVRVLADALGVDPGAVSLGLEGE
jgi:transcriptional regulator with XRE-family HTH domain